MKNIKKILVMLVSIVSFTILGQDGRTMQVVRTENGQVGFLLKASEQEGFFEEVFTFTPKTYDKSVTKIKIENVKYKKHKFNGKVFTISYIDSNLQLKEERYDVHYFIVKHQTGGFFFLLNDIIEAEKIADLVTRSRVASSSTRCSCSSGFGGSKCRVSCPEGTIPVCDCDGSGSKCYCDVPPKAIEEQLNLSEIKSEESTIDILVTQDEDIILVTPNPTSSKIEFYVQNSNLDRDIYSVEIFDSYGTKIIEKQILPEKVDLSNNKKGLYFYVISTKEGYLQKGKIILN